MNDTQNPEEKSYPHGWQNHKSISFHPQEDDSGWESIVKERALQQQVSILRLDMPDASCARMTRAQLMEVIRDWTCGITPSLVSDRRHVAEHSRDDVHLVVDLGAAHGAVSVHHTEDDGVWSIRGMCVLLVDPQSTGWANGVCARITRWYDENTKSAGFSTDGTVHMLALGITGTPYLAKIGVAQVDVQPLGYSLESLAGRERILREFSAEVPAGRLVLIHGPPGSGKTYLIRSMLEKLSEHGVVVYVQPDMVEYLAGPSAINILSQVQDAGRSVYLVVEDADQLLRGREENMSKIASLLNMTSGVMADLLDIRVIATTNLPAPEIDPAMSRPGRLLENLHVGALSPSLAAELLTALVGKPLSVDEPMLLAEVHQLARELLRK